MNATTPLPGFFTPFSPDDMPTSLDGEALDALVETEDPEAAMAFTLRLGHALHRYGAPAHRLEEALTRITRRIGLTAQFFSTPTAIFVTFGPAEKHRTCLIRVTPGEVNLEKQILLDAVADEVARGRLTCEEGSRRVTTIARAKARYGPWVTALSFAIVSGAGARFFAGGVAEIGVSSAIGLAIGGLAALTSRSQGAARIVLPLSALLASAVATLAASKLGAGTTATITLGGLIVLLPGLRLTTAMTELATQHLVSGTARLMGASMDFLQLACGVALGSRIGALLPAASVVARPAALPAWTEGVALLFAGVGLTVLFRARPRDLGWVLAGGAFAYFGARWGTLWLGPELGMGFGSFAVGVFANLYARWARRPASLPLVPGIILLVPGSIGFRSLLSLLEHNVETGVETAFRMVLVAVALVTGLLVANAVVSPRRAL